MEQEDVLMDRIDKLEEALERAKAGGFDSYLAIAEALRDLDMRYWCGCCNKWLSEITRYCPHCGLDIIEYGDMLVTQALIEGLEKEKLMQ